MRGVPTLALSLALLALTPIASAQSEDVPTGLGIEALTALDRQLLRAIEEREFTEARTLATTILDERPRDPLVRYDLARALSMLDEGDASVEALLDAITHGFTDFHRMDIDPLLASAREAPGYARIVAGWGALLQARADAEFEGMKQAFGEEYTYTRDDHLRLQFASAVDQESFSQARHEIARVDRFARAQGLFPVALAGSPKPHAWVSVLIPTREDFRRVLSMPGVGGIYQDQNKRLIVRDIGSSLRHEFFHLLHHRHMGELGQQHAYWVLEGMACVVEDLEDGEGDELDVMPSWRTNIAGRLARSGSLIPTDRFATLRRDQFVGERSRARYAQARAFFMFLHEKGKLGEWYRAYTESFDEDPTGVQAIETVFGEGIRAVDREFRMWASDLPEVGEASRALAVLPFEVRPGPPDGLLIPGRVSRRSIEAGRPLRRGDVILQLEGEATPTMDDLHRLLGERAVGDLVRLSVRRDDERFDVTVRLVESDDASW